MDYRDSVGYAQLVVEKQEQVERKKRKRTKLARKFVNYMLQNMERIQKNVLGVKMIKHYQNLTYR